MIKVLQSLRKIEIYDKAVYTPEVRVAFWKWKKPTFTSGIEIKDEVLRIPGRADQDLKKPNYLNFIESVEYDGRGHVLADPPSTLGGVENMRFKAEGDNILVRTSFSKYRYSEIPVPENHQIALLRPGDSLRLMFNDRYDWSMSVRKQRRYMLYDYIVHYKGMVKKIEYTGTEVRQELQLKTWKEVDLRKIIK